MKGSPVPSCGPTPPPQVPAASRPHNSITSLDKGTEAPPTGVGGGELGCCLSLPTHRVQGTFLFNPSFVRPPFLPSWHWLVQILLGYWRG